MRRSRYLTVALVAVGAMLGSALPAAASDGAAPDGPAPGVSAPDVSAAGEAPPPAAPADRGAVTSRAAVGQTTTYTDDAGRTVFRVDDGFDLDQYRYRGPLSFSFDIDRDYGPVDEHGHPAPGNLLFGKTMLLTLRAWDVDEAQGEVDDVRFNGNLLVPGQLSGANDQWATDTFDVFASWLHLPTPDNPRGTNTVQIDVDRNNDGWAVEIDWAELRPYVPHNSVRPVVLAHGITDNGGGGARSGMWRFDEYLQDTVPGLRNRTSAPPMTLNGSIAANAAILADARRRPRRRRAHEPGRRRRALHGWARRAAVRLRPPGPGPQPRDGRHPERRVGACRRAVCAAHEQEVPDERRRMAGTRRRA